MSLNPFKSLSNRFEYLDEEIADAKNGHTFDNKLKQKTADQIPSSKIKNAFKSPNASSVTKPNINDTNIFPELIQTKQVIGSSMNFNSLNFSKPDDATLTTVDDGLPAGWIRLTRNSVKPIDNKSINVNKSMNETKILDYNFESDDESIKPVFNPWNNLMYTAIEEMKQCRIKYEQQYDDINGDGAFADKYRLPPVYDDEYELDDSDYESEGVLSVD